MAKSLTIAVIFPAIVLVLIGGFFVVPADAQNENIKESCKLSDDLAIKISFPMFSNYVGIGTIKKGSVISSTISATNITGAKLVSNAGVENAVFSDAALFWGQPGVKSAIENKWGLICLVNTINAITSWIFFILISVSFIFILIAGFMWMTGRGEPEKQKQAGQMIAAALVGIVIAILARIIPAIIIGILT